MITKYVALILYTMILTLYIYTYKKKYDFLFATTDSAILNLEIYQTVKRFRVCFFTGWNFVAQECFLIIAILDELAVLFDFSLNIKKKLNLSRSYLFQSIVFPCTLVVSTTFWCLYTIDRELIFPKSLDLFYPLWLNHSVHSVIVVPVIIEIFLPKKYNFIKFRSAWLTLTIFIFTYQTVYLSVYFLHDIWLYPIFKHLSWIQRISFLLFLYGFGVLFLYVGICLQNYLKKTQIKNTKMD